MELDVVAICMDYTEYASLEDFQEEYGAEDYPDIEAIEEVTDVIPVDGGGLIVRNF